MSYICENMKAHPSAAPLEVALAIWHLVHTLCFTYLKVRLQYLGSQYFGEEGREGALYMTDLGLGFYFSLKSIVSLLVSDFQMVYTKQGVAEGVV